jgi:hypothetical protein
MASIYMLYIYWPDVIAKEGGHVRIIYNTNYVKENTGSCVLQWIHVDKKNNENKENTDGKNNKKYFKHFYLTA